MPALGLFSLTLAVACAEQPAKNSKTPRATGQHGSDWPSFLGPTGDSKSSERGILTKWPEGGPPLVWQLSLGTGYGMPVIRSDRLFQFDRHGDQARLRCLESKTGKLLWTFEYTSGFQDLYGYDNGPRCSPVADPERVYIFGAEGMLHCLSVADGQLLWKVDTPAQFGVIQNFFGVGSTPAIEGDLLIVQVGGSPPESKSVPPGRLDQVVGNGSGIVAFDKKTGEVRYKLTDELAGYASPVLSTIGPRRWCFVFARGGLVGFDPVSGKLDFHFPWRAPILESVNASNPVVVGERVFISETYGPGSALLRVKPGEAQVEWSDEKRRRDKAMQTHWNTPVHHEGYLYASSGRHTENAELRCIELATGNVMWSQPDLTRSSLLYVDGHFVCLSEDGTLRLLRANPKKYDPVAEVVLAEKASQPNPFGFRSPRLLKPPAWAAPILSHGLLYVRGADRLVCLELIPGSTAAK
ncbi:MAG: PQQ-like beta-propeller repeat protein [Planctomycetia bacterium]|nr:PQQ-like beta-propeller repeat protein [Planctomycetia bacterium]